MPAVWLPAVLAATAEVWLRVVLAAWEMSRVMEASVVVLLATPVVLEGCGSAGLLSPAATSCAGVGVAAPTIGVGTGALFLCTPATLCAACSSWRLLPCRGLVETAAAIRCLAGCFVGVGAGVAGAVRQAGGVLVAFGVGGEGVALVVGVSGVRVTLETLSRAAVMLWAPAAADR